MYLSVCSFNVDVYILLFPENAESDYCKLIHFVMST